MDLDIFIEVAEVAKKIGSLLGLLAVPYTLKKYSESRPNVVIKEYDSEYLIQPAFFTNTDDLLLAEHEGYTKKKYRAFFHLEIFNKSSNPVTIYQLDLLHDGQIKSQYSEYTDTNGKYVLVRNINSDLRGIVIPISKTPLKFPLRLEPYDMDRGYIMFLLEDNLADTHTNIHIIGRTSRGLSKSSAINCRKADLVKTTELPMSKKIELQERIQEVDSKKLF